MTSELETPGAHSIYTALTAARRWQSECPQPHGGVVLVWDGDVYGWRDQLRNANHERSGVFAAGADEYVFAAKGGNDPSGSNAGW